MTRRTVLVTGGAGFIGSNIVARLAEDPALDVVVCDWLETSELDKWRNLAKHPIADLIDPSELLDWLNRHRRDLELIIHMGAISSTMEADVDKIFRTNFTLSKNIFDWCSEHGIRLIYASSAATYGDGANGFHDRGDLEYLSALRPLNAYGWSKALFDIYVARQVARGSAPPQWVGLKFFNVYGPNEYHKGGMKSVVAQIWPDVKGGRAVKMFKSYRPDIADGGQLRDFVYVRDCVDAISWLGYTKTVSGLFNLGSGAARSFESLARTAFSAASIPAKIEYIEMPEGLRGKYQYFTEAEMDKLSAFGYNRSMTSLEDGVGDYVANFLSQADCYR